MTMMEDSTTTPDALESAETFPAYRPVRQARGAETKRRFRAAAEACFGQRGYAGTKVSEIIKESGCSTGSYYHRFKDKRALFDVMLKEYVACVEGMIEAWDVSLQNTGGLRGLFQFVAEEFRSIIRQFGGFLRAAQELALSEPEIWDSISNLSLSLWQKIEQHLPDYLAEVSAKDPNVAMRGAIQSILTLMLQASLGIGQLFPKSSDEMEELAVASAVGILQSGAE